MNTYKKNWPKFIIGLTACLLIRLIPLRAPNIEPILATQMPFTKAYGAWVGFFFGLAGILSYDLITGTMGKWTLFTASAYGILGFLAHFYFKSRKPSVRNFVSFAIFGTLFFDAVTGLAAGPILFDQPFTSAFFGQIPFTALHLLGNISFAILLSPAIYRFVVRNENLKSVSIINIFSPKRI